MFIPGFSSSVSTSTRIKRRKGSGGNRGSGTSSSTSSGQHRNRNSKKVCFTGECRNATAYSEGGGPVTTIPQGQRFAGRLIGGETREEIYGNRTYGSGYGTHCSSCRGRGVSGRPFPFYFWPIVWDGTALVLVDSYLDAKSEYGTIDDNERPGGSLFVTTFSSPLTNDKFRLISDNTTVNELVTDINIECKAQLGNNISPITPVPLSESSSTPRPEQAIQYYRASSIVLTLDGYNNSATYAKESDINNPNPTVEDSPLPQNIDVLQLLTCLNVTIGLTAPLIDSSNGAHGAFLTSIPSYLNLVALVSTLWVLLICD